MAVELVFVVRCYWKNTEEDIPLCKSLESCTIGEAIFNVIDSYMNECISWQVCVDMYTDGI
jgi:hypothetical protein